ncbi:MAG: hypothetical protein E7514_05490 [Ruminococcaceae bacterium]|nr:hypothetical protein [Oscillospiraceae bacterium]
MDDKIMRTSVFGGFKKEDVLSFVEQLKNEVESLKKDIEAKDNLMLGLNSQIRELTRECDGLKACKAELETATEKISVLSNTNIKMKSELDSLKAVADEYENAKAKLEKGSREIEEAQARLGAAFVDARKYSENIVAAANEKAHKTSEGFSQDISRQATEITRLSGEIDKISDSFNRTVSELHANIAVLAQRMSAAAKNLSLRQDSVFQPELKADFNLDDDATGVIDSNDGSGLTFIQYPPHTEFNEDLNIQPDSDYSNLSKEG